MMVGIVIGGIARLSTNNLKLLEFVSQSGFVVSNIPHALTPSLSRVVS